VYHANGYISPNSTSNVRDSSPNSLSLSFSLFLSLSLSFSLFLARSHTHTHSHTYTHTHTHKRTHTNTGLVWFRGPSAFWILSTPSCQWIRLDISLLDYEALCTRRVLLNERVNTLFCARLEHQALCTIYIYTRKKL